MIFLQNLKERKARKLLNEIASKALDKSKREICKYIVQVSGVRVSDLDPNGPPREIPFSYEKYFKTKNEAIEYGLLEHNEGNKVDVWRLVKRW